MRIMWLRLVVLTTFLTLTVASVADAHVTVSLEEVPAGSFEKLTVSVPTERDVQSPRSGWRSLKGSRSWACGRSPAGITTSRKTRILLQPLAARVPGVHVPDQNPGGGWRVCVERLPDVRGR